MRIVSGIQPTGSLHIGNYLGAIKQWIAFQQDKECIFFIADLHSMTIPYNKEKLAENTLETAKEYLAAGIDPEKSILFVQSDVKEHTELYWFLNTVTPVGDLQRMTQYKEKASQFKKNVNAGLLNYPILQAADILMYKANLVPVGKDQIQHVELTRTIAKRFNQKFGKTFPLPEPHLSKGGAKIMSLTDPGKKMSKSLGPQSYVSLFDSPKEIKKKIMSAVTDTGKEIKYDPKKKPGISNLLNIWSLFSGKTVKEAEKEFRGKGYAYLKESLTELLVQKLGNFSLKKKELEARGPYVKEILKQGAKRAEAIAQSTIEEVREKTGLVNLK